MKSAKAWVRPAAAVAAAVLLAVFWLAAAGADPTGGCLFYYNPKKTSNSYMLSKPVALSIGNHNFCY